ncbi:MAG TPA: protease pro-enzyme activation domain-containing protein, partial [Blastocatellia bacterium]|nr:protease pro-enzyme activation domain-containing protein [Blastocatellia bacterium]
MPTHKLVGSERDPMPGARSVGKTDPNERLEVSVRIRRPAGEQFHSRLSNIIGGGKSAAHMTREEYANNFAAQDSDIAAVKKYAAAHQLAVVQESAERRTVKLSGTVAQFNAAFGVDLQTFEYDGGSYRGRTGPVTLPPELKDIVEGVFGLDNRPQAKPHFRARRAQGNVNWHASPGGPTTFTPPQLATLYNFPDGTGTGEAVALIELGGGYRPSDLKTYFSKIGVKPAPQVIAVSVDHAGNSPTGDPNGPDGEVMLDIEVVGGVAPGAKVVV